MQYKSNYPLIVDILKTAFGEDVDLRTVKVVDMGGTKGAKKNVEGKKDDLMDYLDELDIEIADSDPEMAKMLHNEIKKASEVLKQCRSRSMTREALRSVYYMKYLFWMSKMETL